ncbi:MAG TPA: lysophospholipid acyltransferase family protein [Spirochaetota bacterium]|nr:1-acyl-sn-glycerol-3-phosphate acyltransferase [Spirochaetota bacterium]HOD13946.1 lysophospholipid acyltransferase family protein [Spirochaetota bacterium]HPG49748.1 lysophospholipid acyltransferase family protein [Spirochaetota bacterium]HPN11909.1 lysophospholipid acyltransferase family protein [Spirochaetota bacterium]HQL81138.1 lysophospholipid acyltransferase family protein [Spirochaetota bacterium]
MFNRIISIAFLTFVAITSIPFYLIAALIRLVTYPFDRKLRLLHLFTCFWASLYTWIMPSWRIKVEGREKVRKGATYMIVSNHQSQLDILVAFRLFFHYKWVSKIEIFKVPLIGWNMRLNRYVKLKRGDKESIDHMMKDCEERLSEGSSVFFFPEGTRSADGVIKSFKMGAFLLAHKMKVPLLPIVVSGTNKALPKYSMNFHGKQKILIKVFDEIPYDSFKDMSVEDTAEMVRQFMIKNLAEMDRYTLGDPS